MTATVPGWIIKRLNEWNSIRVRRRSIKSGRMNIPVIAFDTETLDGYCKLICDSSGKYLYFDNIDENNFEKILNFLIQKEYHRSINLFYNIDYDVAAIIKYLNKKDLHQLLRFNNLRYNDSLIHYVPRKIFSIKHNKKWYRFFDLWQFYRSSLDAAVKQYISQEEGKDEIDREKLGTDENYWKENLDKIIKYCIKDARLTAQLGDLLQKKLNELGLSFQNPYSTGTISLRFFAKNFKFPPPSLTEWNKYAYLSYFGGRFEILQRGKIDWVYCYDINSAYPYQIANLIDLNKGKWYRTRTLNEECDIGIYYVLIENMEDDIILPFPFREENGLIFYPQMKNIVHFTTKEELLFALDHYDVDVKIIDGWEFYADEIVYPFKQIEELYKKRNEIKKKDPALQLTLKIIMNSLYGKTAEKRTVLHRTDLEKADDLEVIDNEIVPVKKVLKVGNAFNPVYATLITARTRVALLEEAIKHKEDIVAMFTDSIITTRKFITPSNDLGQWNFECEGECLVIGCGVYTIRDLNKGFIKTRLRGFHIKNDIDLFEICEKNADKNMIAYNYLKSIRPRESLFFKRIFKPDDINRFIEYRKYLYVNMDRKRVWESNLQNFGQLLNDTYLSNPRNVF